jgi:outer membrane protein, adhesin transport system
VAVGDASGTDMETLRQRAAALQGNAVAPAPVATRTAPAPAAAPAQDNTPAGLSVRRLNDWVAAWQSKDVTRYLGFYAPGFKSEQGNVDAWKAKRRALVGKRGPISVKIGNVLTSTLDPSTVETRFQQVYRSVDFNDEVTKVLTWQLIKGEWYIVKESNR